MLVLGICSIPFPSLPPGFQCPVAPPLGLLSLAIQCGTVIGDMRVSDVSTLIQFRLSRPVEYSWSESQKLMLSGVCAPH